MAIQLSHGPIGSRLTPYSPLKNWIAGKFRWKCSKCAPNSNRRIMFIFDGSGMHERQSLSNTTATDLSQ